MTAECFADRACGATERCLPLSGCRGVVGFYCTTPGDTCHSYDDCGGALPCELREGRWQCAEFPCPP